MPWYNRGIFLDAPGRAHLGGGESSLSTRPWGRISQGKVSPNAQVNFDLSHLVALTNGARDQVHRAEVWREAGLV